ncbi:MAG: Gfo/Idh/MocA family protein [Janthinobacterium lividum]
MIALALVGAGKIARDQHLPAIAGDPRFELVATVDPAGGVDGAPRFADLATLIANGPDVQAVALCTPPAVRHLLAAAAIEAGLHVLLEKPPATTLSQADDLAVRAQRRGVTAFAAWHSREAPGVAPAREWLANRTIRSVAIDWREDIRRWHPGQEWILGAGGFGVFDPGINALSILTAILPAPVTLEAATLDVPAGRAAPIAATLTMRSAAASILAAFDFLEAGPQRWSVVVETDIGTLRLEEGGDCLTLPEGPSVLEPEREYPRLYARFADLVEAGASDVDTSALRLVADAFLVGQQREVASFSF